MRSLKGKIKIWDVGMGVGMFNWLKTILGFHRVPSPYILDFDLEDDAPIPKSQDRIIRRKPRSPSRGTRMLYGNVHVAGISQPDCVRAAIKFIDGSNQRLELVKDPHNPHDKNAVRVVGRWSDDAGIEKSAQLGWVPRDTAAELAEDLDGESQPLYATIRAMFQPTRDKYPGIRFDIWSLTVGSKESSAYRGNCSRTVLVRSQTPNHVLHLLLSILTGGLWLIVWAILIVRAEDWRCTRCGPSIGKSFAGARSGGKGPIKTCPHCGTPNRAGDFMCMGCSKPL